jgi:hypothetical protein
VTSAVRRVAGLDAMGFIHRSAVEGLDDVDGRVKVTVID